MALRRKPTYPVVPDRSVIPGISGFYLLSDMKDAYGNNAPMSITRATGFGPTIGPFSGTAWTMGGNASAMFVQSGSLNSTTVGKYSAWMWIRPDTAALATGTIYAKNGSGNSGFRLNIVNNTTIGLLILRSSSNTQINATLNTALTQNVWTQLAFTWNGTGYTTSDVGIYQDGVPLSTTLFAAGAGLTNGTDVTITLIGALTNTGSGPTNATYDHFGFATRQLTDAEIARLYVDPFCVVKPRFPNRVGIVSGNANVNLTAVTSSATAASFTPSASVGFGGVSGSATISGFGSELDIGFSSVSSTAAVGSLGIKVDVGFSGVAGTGSVTGVLGSLSAALSSATATASVGNFAFNPQLSPATATSGTGTFTAKIDVAISAVFATGAVASLKGKIDTPYIATAISSGVGSFTASTSGGNLNVSLGSAQALAAAAGFVFSNQWPLTRPFTRLMTRSLTRIHVRNL